MLVEILNHMMIMFVEMSKYLIIGLIFVGILHVYFSKEFISKHIGENSIWSIIKAAILGVPLPICSCGVVPTSIFLAKSGASKGSVVSFLVSTPQTGVDSIAATYGMMGGLFAIFRPLSAFFMGIAGGIVTKLFDDQAKFSTPPTVSKTHCHSEGCCNHSHKPKSKIKEIFNYAFVEFLDDISLQFVTGVIIAGLISFFLPANFFSFIFFFISINFGNFMR
jgi:uncharacterized membrane protein YraQ (UPF0718 family)